MVCHSLGGVIGRASLKYLQLHKDKFNHFISLCSPHLGYLYHSSTLISTSLWILNMVKKDPSMIELTLSDNADLNVLWDVCRKRLSVMLRRGRSWTGLRRFGCLGRRRMNMCHIGQQFWRIRTSSLRLNRRKCIRICWRIWLRIFRRRLFGVRLYSMKRRKIYRIL
jgi:pimeloyl-ACP methyl ester carboxylesterase